MNRHSRAGFTLIELMVVLALLALTAVAAIPAFAGDARQSPEERVARELVRDMLAARDAARETGIAASFVLSPSDGRYWIITRDSSRAGTLTLASNVSLGSPVPTDRVEVRFTPQGVTTPVTIVVTGERTLGVSTDPWSGDVSIEARNAR